ncbi:uncharacterized protein K02A2.6-like [Mizuhopecten yessoensis]|uniref:uncharacterized protein K02A2.6-like n=1 Tax=Mizuhopecten yessoensis TaxID=6573 RepID=UPI000B45E9B8|nr:uncharacterized protein K02A2.6-like [Mizuhopecten yessoensis]
MAGRIGRIDTFDQGNESWDSYGERLEQYFICNDVKEEKRVPALLSLVGGNTYQLLRGLTAPKKPSEETFERLGKLLKDHFNPKPLVIAERFRFHKRDQREGESIRDYVAAIRKLSEYCEFNATLSDSLRDRLVCGLRNEHIQRKLLSEATLTYDTAVELAIAIEMAQRDATELHGNSSKASGHIKKACPERKKNTHHTNYDSESDSESDSCAGIASLEISSTDNGERNNQAIWLYPKINSIKHKMELDTGSAVSVVTEKVYVEQLNGKLKDLSDTQVYLKTYSGEKLRPRGIVNVRVEYEGQKKTLKLYVVPKGGTSLFGRDWLREITLKWPAIKAIRAPNISTKTRLDGILARYQAVFNDDWGTLKNMKAKLNVKPDSHPKFCKARSAPYAIKPKVSDELDRLEEAGVLTKVRHSEWATPIVPVMKRDGSVRLCGDFKVTVNKVLEVEQYPLPRTNDIFASLAGGQKFSKLDLQHAYLQMEVEEESKPLLTINTEKGLYRFNRLVYGIASAPAIWQRAMDTVLQGLSGVKCIIDDMLVTGQDDDDHLRNIEAVLERLDEYGLRVKKDKCEFFRDKLSFCGHEIDAEGLHKADNKVEAVLKAPEPSDVSELRAFLGLVNYYGRFLPNLSTTLYPLHKLLEKDKSWEWNTSHRQAFQEVKTLVTSTEVLTHYDPNKPLRLACDASPRGLGAVLSHVMEDKSERPIAYASRSLNAAERNYSQIDKEALGLVWGVKHFHDYLFGRRFTLLTDHKPLVAIFNPEKSIPTTTASRMQRYALFLSGLTYDIEYKHTKAHGNADSLSRLPLKGEGPVDSDDDKAINALHISQLDQLPVTQTQIRRETIRDPLLSTVYQSVMNGWEDIVDPDLKHYAARKTELTVHQGCLLWGMRVIIPPKLRRDLLSELHQGHIGVVKMKAVARSYMWWPGLDQDIELMCKTCAGCQEVKHAPPGARLHPWEWPTRPWHRVHIDFAGPFLDSMFLIAVDAHSKWPEVVQMKSTTAERTIEVLRTIFARNGVPRQIVSDNGPQFKSELFHNFMRLNGIKHITSAPYHPSTNGLAERFVQSFKMAMKSSGKDAGSIQKKLSNFLLAYRNSPQSTTNETPAKMFLGRNLPSRLDLLRPTVQERVEQRQEKMSERRHTHTRNFEAGQTVMIRDYRGERKWLSGTIQEKTGPVSYRIQVSPGVIWRRHVDQMRDANVPVAQTFDTPIYLPRSNSLPSVQQGPINVDSATGPPSDATVTVVEPMTHAPIVTEKTIAQIPACEPRFPKRATRVPPRFKDYVAY